MIDNGEFNKKIELKGPEALVVFVIFLGIMGYVFWPKTFTYFYELSTSFANVHESFMWSSFIALAINVILAISITTRFFGYQKQGSRLAVLSNNDNKASALPIKRIAVSAIIGVVAYILLLYFYVNDELDFFYKKLSNDSLENLKTIFTLNLALSGSILTYFISRLSLSNGSLKLLKNRLPEKPKLTNGIVLGSTDEDDKNKNPSWVIQYLHALYGNILLTGSIGGGKTQGGILQWIDQILSNFTLRPSVLAIDPKGTFVPLALQIIRRYGMDDHVLHLKLGGDVRINPLYQKDILKGSRVTEIAQMVKAAAANTDSSAAGYGSDFWDKSAFNLTKNTLIYCYATRGYCTLRDLYEVMVKAMLIDFTSELTECLSTSHFDQEEKYNISCAIQYFDFEYKQLDEKVRTSILATATSFLNQFQDYQANQIFCAEKSKLTVTSMDEVIDQGKILLFNVKNTALSRSMGTFIKLLYEQSVLNRMTDENRNSIRSTVLIMDEYQDIVSTGSTGTIGDVSFLAKAREANSITIAATQSLISLENAIGREKATAELIQNFRTRIMSHSSDLKTIQSMRELAGKREVRRTSHSVSENSQHPSRNLILGGFEAKDANISESISSSEHKEDIVTGQDFSRLRTYECYGLIFDGIETYFKKIFLKPYYLKRKNTVHSEVLKGLKKFAMATAAVVTVFSNFAFSFPNVCSVVKTDEFNSCLDFKVSACACGFPPRPCAQFSYYVPQTFIESMPDPKSSYFDFLPGAAAQIASVGYKPYGVESDDDTQSFQAHTITVPLTFIPFSLLPCGGAPMDSLCLNGMSEHLGRLWETGSGDSLQPNFLAWGLRPKDCLLKGAAMSISGEVGSGYSFGFPSCSVPMSWLSKFPPSSHSACTGWGVFYPRSGTYNGGSQTVGALMIGARMKSLSAEVFHSIPASFDETWQMISPQSSSCFREGQNIGLLETIKGAREFGRLTSGKLKGHLFTIWSKVSCCKDLTYIPTSYLAIEAMKITCKALGGL